MSLAPDARVALQPWVRLRFDPVRGRHVLLAPERVLFPCPTSVEVLVRLGTGRALGEVVAELAAEFDAPRAEIARDVTGLLGGLAEQGLLRVEGPADG
jgi:coenzyme PQQ biosynthesis protein PqqD